MPWRFHLDVSCYTYYLPGSLIFSFFFEPLLDRNMDAERVVISKGKEGCKSLRQKSSYSEISSDDVKWKLRHCCV